MEQQALPQWLAVSTYRRGHCLAAQGESEEGISLMRQGLAAWQATGGEMGRPGFLAYFAEACGKIRRHEEALAALAEALDLVRKTRERLYEAELYRVRGDVLLTQEDTEKAAKCLLQAIAIAQKQRAKSLELRAVMSLARLWAQQKDTIKKAREMLAEIYGWFMEGFDTKDLQEAKALLAEIDGGHHR